MIDDACRHLGEPTDQTVTRLPCTSCDEQQFTLFACPLKQLCQPYLGRRRPKYDRSDWQMCAACDQFEEPQP